MVRLLCLTDSIACNCPSFQSFLVADQLRQQGHPVRLVTFDSPDSMCHSSAASSWITSLPLNHPFDVTQAKRVLAYLREFQPEIIHVWGSRAIRWVGWMAPLIGRSKVVVSHDRHDLGRRSAAEWLRGMAWRGADLHLVPHDSAKSSIQKIASRRSRIETLPWGWPASIRHTPGTAPVTPLPSGQKLVASCLPYDPRSKLKDVIWASELLNCIREDVHWMVIGNGTQEWRLKRFAAQQPFGRKVQFLDWNQVQPRDWDRLSVFLQPSAAYTDFNGVMCAMSNGVPIVAANHQIARHFVDNGRSGYLIESGARNEIARCVNRLINRPDLASQFGEHGRRLLHKNFGFQVMMARLKDHYDSLLGASTVRQAA